VNAIFIKTATEIPRLLNLGMNGRREEDLACTGYGDVLDQSEYQTSVAIPCGLDSQISRAGSDRQSGQAPQGIILSSCLC
jgi:hypothetical protein